MPDLFHFDLFISYSRDDNRERHISELVSLIQKEYRDFTGGEELRVFFDKGEFAGMDDWQHHNLDGISSSHLLLACLSPNYLDSEYCLWEFDEYWGHMAGRTPPEGPIGPIFFVEIPARSDRGFEQRAADWVAALQRRQHFDFRPWFDEGAVYLKEAAVKALINNAGSPKPCGLRHIHRVIDAKGNVDQRNEHFVGRSTEMRWLREIVAFGKMRVLTAINGQDGIGKTALAVEYSHAFAHKSFRELGKETPSGVADPWQEILERLCRQRLLHVTARPCEARMHPLVQELTKLNAGADTVWARERALLLYVKGRAEFLWEGWVRPEHRWELVPLIASAWHWMERGAKEGAYLANQAFGAFQNLESFAEAEPLMRHALVVDERSCGLNHPNVATCLNNLAALLHETNRPKEAESLYRRALAINQQSFGQDDPRVATCLNNLAQLLQATNRLEEAESLYRRALSIDERGFGPSHPKVATHLNNLAQLLRVTNRLEEAEPLYRRALAIDEEGLGPNHPRVASHLSNLAQLLQATNRPEEAKPLYRRALSIDEQSFGPNHPRVATHLNNLALLLKATDQPAEAEPLYRRALSIDGQNFGWDHPNVGTDLNNLATLLETTNRLDEAESLMRLMLGVFLRSSASQGHEHPFLQVAIRNYTALLAEMGRSPVQIIARLEELARPFGISFASQTRCQIAQQCYQRQTVRLRSGRRGYQTALKLLFGKAAALLKGIAVRQK